MEQILPLEPLLITRSLSKDNRKVLEEYGLKYVEQALIHSTINENWEEAYKLFCNLEKANVVVTSKNGAEALIDFLSKFPEHRSKGSFFAVGMKTRKRLQRAGILAYKPKIHDAEGLADFMIEQASRKQRPAVFFHGNLALDTLPNRLHKAQIPVHKVLAYQTKLLQADLSKLHFNSVAFMSPSAVDAFAQSAGFELKPNFVFSIGSTTGKKVESFWENGIVLGGKKPSFESLIKLIYQYKQNLA